MKIAVLGAGPIKRKQVTTALDRFAEDAAVTIVAPQGDEPTDATRFAIDWADGTGAALEECQTEVDCAASAGLLLVAWDDAEVCEIEIWVANTGGRVLDLTNDLAEITLEGEPDEAQQPSHVEVTRTEAGVLPVTTELPAQLHQDAALGRAFRALLAEAKAAGLV